MDDADGVVQAFSWDQAAAVDEAHGAVVGEGGEAGFEDLLGDDFGGEVGGVVELVRVFGVGGVAGHEAGALEEGEVGGGDAFLAEGGVAVGVAFSAPVAWAAGG